jgi:hypothetical protein
MRVLGGKLIRPFDKHGPSHLAKPFRYTRGIPLHKLGDRSDVIGDAATPLAWLLAWETVAEREASA